MPTETLKTRRNAPVEEHVGSSFAGSVILHLAIAGSILGWSLWPSHSKNWGDAASQAGTVQATMVDALPLPPHQRFDEKNVLTSDSPSPAPPPPTPKAVEAKRPDEVLIPDKSKPKPVKEAEKAAPEPPKHAQPPTPTPKATTGETSGVRVAMATQQTKSGTSTVTIQERSFGERFPYYVDAVGRKINQNWFQQEADSRTSIGKKVTISFTINADGSVGNLGVAARSGSPSLDSSAIRALQRIDTFGPLPQAGLDHVTVQYTFIPQ